MSAMRVISLDLDDTLWPVAPVLAAAEAALHEWLQARYPRTMHGHSINTMRALRAKIAAQFPEQSHDLTFLRRRALATQFIGAGYAESACEEALEVFLAARNRVEFFDDVRPALERLRTRYRLFALSNGNADLQRCGLEAFFDGHVSAIADDPITDVVGARQAGMQTAWLNRDARSWPVALAPPARTISTLAEIL
jgi:putative hydrolase of the HAD superfamily